MQIENDYSKNNLERRTNLLTFDYCEDGRKIRLHQCFQLRWSTQRTSKRIKLVQQIYWRTFFTDERTEIKPTWKRRNENKFWRNCSRKLRTWRSLISGKETGYHRHFLRWLGEYFKYKLDRYLLKYLPSLHPVQQENEFSHIFFNYSIKIHFKTVFKYEMKTQLLQRSRRYDRTHSFVCVFFLIYFPTILRLLRPADSLDLILRILFCSLSALLATVMWIIFPHTCFSFVGTFPPSLPVVMQYAIVDFGKLRKSCGEAIGS